MTPELDLPAKASLTSGKNTWHTKAVPGLRTLVMSDGPHGVRHQGGSGDNLGIGTSTPATCFPTASALAASWDVDLLRRVGQGLGAEARGLGVHVLLGPGLNIKRSPLGGRNFEYFSEDPLVSGHLAAAMVEGIQSQGVAATPKHFAVNNQETDRMRVNAVLDERTLREIYLAGFEHVVTEARPWVLMSAYNRINGDYASEARWLLTDILRGEWGFDGLVVSDWSAVNDRVASVGAGLDLEMPFSHTDDAVEEAVRSGALDESVLDDVAARLCRLAARVHEGGEAVDPDAQHRLAREAAAQSVVLLKNTGVLPLAHATKIAVIGELARTPRIQGGGSSRVVPTRIDNPLEALTERLDVTFAPGYSLDGPGADDPLIAGAVAAVTGAQAAVVFLGLANAAESEGFDREHIDLPAGQRDLLRALSETGVPLIVVLTSGGILEVASWAASAGAILHGSLLGQAGGSAIADILTGEVNPSGKLTETIPLRLADNIVQVNFPGADGQVFYGEGRYVGYRYFNTVGKDVAYPFGHGLSYTTFDYSDLEVTPTATNSWQVSARITNTGPRAGAEIVQLYISGTEGEPAHGLQAFTKVHLAPGESAHVVLDLTPRSVAAWDARNRRWRVDGSQREIQVGASSRDIRLRAVITTIDDGFVADLTPVSTVGEWLQHPGGGPLLREFLAPLSAGVGDQAPELLGLLLQIPLVKLVTWPLGLTHEIINEMCADANSR